MRRYFILNYYDFLLVPIYIFIIMMVANAIQKKNELKKPEYKYFRNGLLAKLWGGMALAFIYQFYYDGGDTTNYFNTAKVFSNLIFKDFGTFISIIFGDNSKENYSIFDENTGYPFFWNDDYAYHVACICTPFCILGAKSYLCTTLLLSTFCYSGMWKLYQVFCAEFPKIKGELAIAILFIPSVVFWGSGILKDTITISATGWFVYGFYNLLIKRRFALFTILSLVISSFLLIVIKPYIFFALLPGSIIWLTDNAVKGISHKFIKNLFTPVILAIGLAIGYFTLNKMGSVMGEYKVDNILNRAVVVQADLKRDFYQGNTFDIGEVKADPLSMLSKSPVAIFASLFRPTLLDVRNPVMFLSALENTYILFLTIFLIFKLRVIAFFGLIRKTPLLFFSFLFAIFFAFSVGISTPNFGALVRLRIPCLPFYLGSLFIIKHLYELKQFNKTISLKRINGTTN